MPLPPTVFRGPQRVMAGKARKLGILGPDIFLVEAFVLRAPREPVHRCAQLHCLASAPLAHADPSRILRGFSRLRFARNFPVPRHHCGKRIQLEIQIGMPRGDHFVVDKFILCP